MTDAHVFEQLAQGRFMKEVEPLGCQCLTITSMCHYYTTIPRQP